MKQNYNNLVDQARMVTEELMRIAFLKHESWPKLDCSSWELVVPGKYR